MADEIAIGIDLGTTNSVVAVFESGAARILLNRQGEALTPSAVGLDRDGGGLLVGRPAKDLLALEPGRAAAFFKRGMGQDMTWQLGADRYSAVELSALVLRTLAEDAARELGRPVERCVVTVPAYFDEEQRSATMKAGELAGLKVDRILNEPTAAAMAYGLHNADREMQFMVFDLGGGTLDVCVMELFEGILQVKSTAGESWLGGEDFSRALAEQALKELGISLDLVVDGDRPEHARILRRAELVKRRLSSADEVELRIPPIAGKTETELVVMVDQVMAEKAWKPLVDRLIAPMRQALRGANIAREELDAVILVGGATRMPIVRRIVSEFTGKEPMDALDPDLAVAQGAAVQAALVLRDDAVQDVVVTDVLSHSIGIEIVRTIGGRMLEGYYCPVIHRNTTIPNTRTESFFTVRDEQTEIVLNVFEGESRRVEENRLIGELHVKGIPKGPAGQEVEVCVTIDLNGLLEVEARVKETGKTLARVFERGAQKLSPKEIEKAKKRIERLKEDPRKQPQNRELLLRAQVLWAELPPHARYEIEVAMDSFEAAILAREPLEIASAKEQLREICDELDQGERW